jgi:hypothetical protein
MATDGDLVPAAETPARTTADPLPSTPAPVATTTEPVARPRVRLVAVVVLVATAVAFMALSWSNITRPFGDSDDGINGAVWGADSQALRDLGPVDSRLGGKRADGTEYANHPPLIVLEAAVVESVVGEHPWATRAGAWLGALATIPLLFLLLREIVGDDLVAATATSSALLCHMLTTYGPMLDTMVIAFPLAVLVAWRWYREWIGRGSTNWALLAGLCLVTSLGGWQATFLVGLCGLAWVARAIRGRRALIRRALPYLFGAAAATVATVVWARWVYGGTLAPLTEKLGRRSGESSGVSYPDMVTFQVPWLAVLLGVGFVACIVAVVSIRDRRFRPIAILSLVAVFVYALIFREGAGGHQYWNYWAMLPAGIGFAYAYRAVARWSTAQRQSPRARATILIGATVVVALVNLIQPNLAQAQIDDGDVPLQVVHHAVDTGQLPRDQTDLPYVSEPYRADDWLRYAHLPPGTPLLSRDQLETLARDHPDHLVLVLGECASPDPTGICDRLDRLAPHDRLVPAAELVRDLG